MARNAVEPLLEEGLSPLLDTSLHDSSGAVQRQSAVFTLNEYRCHAALLPRGTAGSYLLVAALQDMGFVHRHAVQTVVQYGAIWFTGTLAAGDHQLAADRQSAGSDGIGHAAAEGVHRRSRARTAQPAGRSKSKPGRCVPHSCD